MSILVMFDIDGTLTQTVDIDTACFSVAIGEIIGTHVQPDEWIASPHMTDVGITDHLFRTHHHRGAQAHEVHHFRQRFTELLEQSLSANGAYAEIATRGARSLLTALMQDSECEIAIATGACKPAATLKLKHAQLFEAHIPLATSDDSMARTGIMQRARQLSLVNAQHKHVVYVGDGLWDAKASADLNWPFVGVAAKTERASALANAGAAIVLPDFSDTLKTIERIKQIARTSNVNN
jgi:phosphoglycolate phosphatase-like HAD superfamily hydrolase